MNSPAPSVAATTEDPERITVMARMAHVGAAMALVAAILMGALGYSPLTIAGLLGLSLTAGSSGILLRHASRPNLANAATLTGYIITLVCVSIGIGGLLAGVTPWLALTPLLTIAYGDRRMARGSLALAIVAIVGLGAYTLQVNWNNPDVPPARIMLQVLSVSAAAVYLYRVSQDQELMRRMALAHLTTSNSALRKELEQHRHTQSELEGTTEKLVSAARAAGMAEVATGVVHNMGNALNSVNVAVSMLHKQLDDDLAVRLERAADHALDTDPEQLRSYLLAIAANHRSRTKGIREEADSVRERLNHVAIIVQAQQVHARSRGLIDDIRLSEAVQASLSLVSGVSNQGIDVRIEGAKGAPNVSCERHKLLQILANLIGNARDAIREAGGKGTITIGLRAVSEGAVITVGDDGIGIEPHVIKRVFEHGFTTKSYGNGFGLHASALAASELGGHLSCHSDGRGAGTTFTLQLPLSSDQGIAS